MSIKQFPPLVLAYFLGLASLLAQSHHGHASCVLPVGPAITTPVSVPYKGLRPVGKAANIQVTFLPNGSSVSGNTCSTWPLNARTAFNFAVGIYESLLTSTQTIEIQACWSGDLASGTLGSARAAGFFANNLTTPTSAVAQALSEKLLDQNNGNPDIITTLNANRTDWYFGTDASPSIFQIDFVTVVLHEITHGLGFAGAENIDDGIGSGNSVECNGVVNAGCLGFSNFTIPTVYTLLVEDAAGTSILDLASNPSVQLGNYLRGLNGDLFLNGPSLSSPAKVFTPNVYNGGSSYSHLDFNTFFPNELMVPSLSAGVAIHDPGIALQVLEDMGWGNLSLPVELVDFKVAVLNEGAKLEWETARERNNRGFYVERSGDGRSWERLGFVNGAGDADEAQFYSFIDLAPLLGTNFYRLRQVDFGGEEAFSPVESIEWNRPDQRQPLVLSPNPTQDWFMVRHSTVEPPNSFRILNSAGQQVLAGAWPSNGQFNVFQLPAGVYFLEVQGRNGLDWVKWAKR